MNVLKLGNNILLAKYKFFLSRFIGYFSFFLIPLWLQKTIELNGLVQIVLAFIYMIFISIQWYFLGKELDHRLKIYYRTNSSLDRILYRAFIGGTLFLLYFNLLSMISGDWLRHFFWGTFVALGLFYSWPTRGKIIQEGISSQFGEYRFLDSFEKTLLFLTFLMFFVSIPEVPRFDTVNALKLYIDPLEQIHPMYWNFMEINYFPFAKVSKLNIVAWHLHFYVYGLGFFLVAFYGVLRHFFSRRLSILGVFAVISSWTISKMLEESLIVTLVSTFPLIWIWGMLWALKSATYRSGLFLGVLTCFGTLLNPTFIIMGPILTLVVMYFESEERTPWYKKQVFKYTCFGLIVGVLVAIVASTNLWSIRATSLDQLLNIFKRYLAQKSFFSLSILGLCFLLIKLSNIKKLKLAQFVLDVTKMKMLLVTSILILAYGAYFEPYFVTGYSFIWLFSFLAIIPLEWVFQSISRLRSRRNLIYLVYILVCLLDSHFEGRVKILLTYLKY
jgi:hypothetical protein